MQINVPDKTFLVYKLVFIGSKHSLFPIIYDVLAVGINAVNKEL